MNENLLTSGLDLFISQREDAKKIWKMSFQVENWKWRKNLNFVVFSLSEWKRKPKEIEFSRFS